MKNVPWLKNENKSHLCQEKSKNMDLNGKVL